MARKRADKEPAEGQDAGTTPQNGGGKVSKAGAVRAAIAEGIDVPEEGVAFILKKFGIEITKPQFSSYKSQDKARQQKKGGDTPAKRGRPASTAPVTASTPAPSLPSGNANLAISVEAIKTLVEQYGVEQVVSIARLFAK